MLAPLVVDASLTFRLLLPGDKQAQYRGLVGGWLRDGAELVAPTLWLYEMTSALCKTVNLGALLPAEGEQALALATRGQLSMSVSQALTSLEQVQ